MSEQLLQQQHAFLKVLTFNLLAPCYHQLANWALEADQEMLWKERTLNILNALEGLHADILCLQEFWFSSKKQFKQLFEHRFPHMNPYYLQRTGRKPDGLAVFLAPWLTVKATQSLVDDEVGNRVALLLHIEQPGDFHLLLINTHLTFPHNHYDEKVLRLEQIEQITTKVQAYISSNALENFQVILCGDFNSPYLSKDVVVQHLVSKGFVSSYKHLHGKEPGCTHFNHQNEAVCTDYIWFKTAASATTSYVPQKAILYPEELSNADWPHQQFVMSDHRPLMTTFQRL